MRTVVVFALLALGTAAHAEDRGFRYRDGTCLNADGIAGYNPAFVGPCGMLAVFGRAGLEGRTSLEGAVINEASLARARLDQGRLRGAELIGAILQGSRLRGADLRMSELVWADLAWVRAQDADFRGANLRGANLSYARFEGADFRGADLSGTQTRGDRHWKGARWDRFTVLPESWGSTLDARIGEARRRGMTYVETSLDPNAVVSLVNGNPWRPCSRPTRFPKDSEQILSGYEGGIPAIPPAQQFAERPSFEGTWEGEWQDVAGRLVIGKSERGVARAKFESFEPGRLDATLVLRSCDSGSFGVAGNRVLFEWKQGDWSRGGGWMLVSSDSDGLTGGFRAGLTGAGMSELGFVRVEP